MLCAYYQRGIDSHGLFDDLAVAQGPTYAAHLNAYDVVYLDMRQFLGEAGCAAAVPGSRRGQIGFFVWPKHFLA